MNIPRTEPPSLFARTYQTLSSCSGSQSSEKEKNRPRFRARLSDAWRFCARVPTRESARRSNFPHHVPTRSRRIKSGIDSHQRLGGWNTVTITGAVEAISFECADSECGSCVRFQIGCYELVRGGESLTFERTREWELVRQIATHPKVLARNLGRFSPSPDDWEPEQDDRVWYVLAKSDGGSVLGMSSSTRKIRFFGAPTVASCRRVGENKRLNAYQEACSWLWANSSCLRIIGSIPECNSLALGIALKCGMDKWESTPRAIKRAGSCSISSWSEF